MKIRNLLALFLSVSISSCSYQDLSKTLHYSDNTPVAMNDIKFQDLQTMKQGKACVYNLLYILPVIGNNSIMAAAKDGLIDNVRLIGKTGYWAFPFSKTCTVVYGY